MDKLIFRRRDLKLEVHNLEVEDIRLEHFRESRLKNVSQAEEVIFRDQDGKDYILKHKDSNETLFTVSKIPKVSKARYYKIHEIIKMLGGEEIVNFRSNYKNHLLHFDELTPFEKAKYAEKLEEIVRRANEK